MRIVAIHNTDPRTGVELHPPIYLDVPQALDMNTEEMNWFAAGGGTPRNFAKFLIKRGAKKVTSVEDWHINYQS